MNIYFRDQSDSCCTASNAEGMVLHNTLRVINQPKNMWKFRIIDEFK